MLVEEAQARLNKLNGQLMTADRVQLPDRYGDLWTFRCVTYSRYPGVGDGSFVLMCMQPTCAEWAAVRPADLQADQEISRLIPAMKFMRQEFHRGPTLGEISRTVHLSPFHFHRRFAELLGLTPKHYLLECQITQAKLELRARKKELAQIATDCGFAHQSHFTSRFKQATGLTPTRWRRLAVEKAA
jgi:AraC-like DNA-binding protein